MLRTGFRSLASQLTSTDEDAAEAMQIDGGSTASEQETLEPSEKAFQEKVLSTICDEYIYHSRTEVSLQMLHNTRLLL